MDLLKTHTKLKYNELQRQTSHWGFQFVDITASTSLIISSEINPDSLNKKRKKST